MINLILTQAYLFIYLSGYDKSKDRNWNVLFNFQVSKLRDYYSLIVKNGFNAKKNSQIQHLCRSHIVVIAKKCASDIIKF